MSFLFRRLAFLIRRRRAERELVEELQFHREMVKRDLRRSGMPDSEVVHAVSRAMGNMTLAREDARALWGYPWLDSLWQDVRHGVRSLRRSPGLIVISALSLGLGIGINTLLYVGANVVYRHHPTMADPDRMVGVEPGNANQFSYPDYQELLRSAIFADVRLQDRKPEPQIGRPRGACRRPRRHRKFLRCSRRAGAIGPNVLGGGRRRCRGPRRGSRAGVA